MLESIRLERVEIEHDTTKERRTLDVESVSYLYVYLRWPLAGLYRLILESNTMQATSAAARRKNPFCLWHAVDIERVRETVKVHIDGLDQKEQTRLRMEVHKATMPGQNRVLKRGY